MKVVTERGRDTHTHNDFLPTGALLKALGRLKLAVCNPARSHVWVASTQGPGPSSDPFPGALTEAGWDVEQPRLKLVFLWMPASGALA